MSKLFVRLNFGFLVMMLFTTSVLADNPVIIPQSVIATNNLLPIKDVIATEFYEPSRAVARMEAGGGGYCTGFRVGSNLFLTNHHCMEFKPCSEVRFHLGYETALPAAKHVYFKCIAVETSLLNLDFALYRVQRIASSAIDDYPILTLANTIPPDLSLAFLPSHPATGLKQIDKSNECQLIAGTHFQFEKRTNISHSCDTMSGSSGGPLIHTESKRVIGLHWGGVSKDSPYRYNHAIPMPKILEFIARDAPNAYDELSVE